MSSITLGGLSIAATPMGAVFTLDEGEASVTLTPRQARAAEQFLARHVLPERRTGFRVPLASIDRAVRRGFAVTLRYRGGLVETEPVDLSLTGTLVRTEGLGGPKPGTIVDTTISLGERRVTLRGEVIRSQGDLLALHFAESLRGGELTPPESLLAIYRKLEIAYLRQRSGAEPELRA